MRLVIVVFGAMLLVVGLLLGFAPRPVFEARDPRADLLESLVGQSVRLPHEALAKGLKGGTAVVYLAQSCQSCSFEQTLPRTENQSARAVLICFPDASSQELKAWASSATILVSDAERKFFDPRAYYVAPIVMTVDSHGRILAAKSGIGVNSLKAIKEAAGAP